MTKPIWHRRIGWLFVPLTAVGWVAGLLLLLGLPSSAEANNHMVPGVCGATIQACINSPLVAAGDTLIIAAGTYTESVVMTKSVSLTGLPGQASITIIRAPASSRVLQVTTFVSLPITIDELTVTGGDAHGHGGGILLQSSQPATLTHVIFDNNKATSRGGGLSANAFVTLSSTTFISNASVDNGGGAYVEFANVTDSYFERNYCTGFCSGGAIVANKEMTLTNATVLSNSSAYNGGGVASGLHMIVNGGLFRNNTSGTSGYGGGGLISFGTAEITGATFISNSAKSYGGGINIWLTGTVANTTLLSNTTVLTNGQGGGAVMSFSTGNPSTITGGRFEGNTSGGMGGGLLVNGPLTMTGTDFVGNIAQRGSGGGAITFGVARLAGVTFENNTVITGDGGGLRAFNFLYGEALTFSGNTILTGSIGIGRGGGARAFSAVLTDSIFINNRTEGIYGGGLDTGAVVLHGGAFTGNVAAQFIGGGGGGGLIAVGHASISGTQFYSNTSTNWGGGAYLADFNGTVALTNVQFTRNTAVLGSGGGLFTWLTSTLTNVDFYSNTSGEIGGGAYAGYLGGYPISVVGGSYVSNTAASGGGMYGNGVVAVEGTEFIRNQALVGNGGGLQLAGRSATLVNVLLAANSASSAIGLAVSASSTQTVQILHTTIAAPNVLVGSAIQMIGPGSLGVTNTIITSHTIGISAAGNAYEDYNLFFGVTLPDSGATGGTHDAFGSPAFANPLADDYHLGLASMAIDFGAEGTGVGDDFDGDPRPIGPRPDIGYDEAPLRYQVRTPAVYR